MNPGAPLPPGLMGNPAFAAFQQQQKSDLQNAGINRAGVAPAGSVAAMQAMRARTESPPGTSPPPNQMPGNQPNAAPTNPSSMIAPPPAGSRQGTLPSSQPDLTPLPDIRTEDIQALLDENQKLLIAIVQAQNAAAGADPKLAASVSEYSARLHRNLVSLATLADQSQVQSVSYAQQQQIAKSIAMHAKQLSSTNAPHMPNVGPKPN